MVRAADMFDPSDAGEEHRNEMQARQGAKMRARVAIAKRALRHRFGGGVSDHLQVFGFCLSRVAGSRVMPGHERVIELAILVGNGLDQIGGVLVPVRLPIETAGRPERGRCLFDA